MSEKNALNNVSADDNLFEELTVTELEDRLELCTRCCCRLTLSDDELGGGGG